MHRGAGRPLTLTAVIFLSPKAYSQCVSGRCYTARTASCPSVSVCPKYLSSLCFRAKYILRIYALPKWKILFILMAPLSWMRTSCPHKSWPDQLFALTQPPSVSSGTAMIFFGSRKYKFKWRTWLKQKQDLLRLNTGLLLEECTLIQSGTIFFSLCTALNATVLKPQRGLLGSMKQLQQCWCLETSICLWKKLFSLCASILVPGLD